MIRQAVILAGGRGTRLGDVCLSTPKPLLSVAGKPFLEYLVWNLSRHGITRLLFSVGHLAERIIDHFGDGSSFGVEIDYVVETSPLGTGGGLKHAAGKLEENFLVLNGDTLFDINFLDLAVMHQSEGAAASLALRKVEDAGRYGTVRLEGSRIAGFSEKSEAGPGIVSGGIYAMSRAALELLPEGVSSIEHDLFPDLAEAGLLHGRAYSGFFLDIGLPQTLQSAQVDIPAWVRKPAVFFDRDGVLNMDYGYVHEPERFDWLMGVPEAIKRCNDRGCLVIVITNQSGIGRGYYSEEQFLKLMDWANESLWSMGAHIDAVYFCPHHPKHGKGEYLKACRCRKPAPGLIDQALKDWDIDVPRSVMIGDSASDIQAAEARGIAGRLFRGADLLEFLRQEGICE